MAAVIRGMTVEEGECRESSGMTETKGKDGREGLAESRFGLLRPLKG